MTEIVNLRRARKEKARAAKEEQAAENRARFGVPKKEIAVTKARSSLATKTLEGHRLGADKALKK
jgi:Domain of unknown function (DUF4169)